MQEATMRWRKFRNLELQNVNSFELTTREKKYDFSQYQVF